VRKKRTLDDHLELSRCFDKFARLHPALKFGHMTRTPAMQAGLASKQLSFRDIFTARPAPPPVLELSDPVRWRITR